MNHPDANAAADFKPLQLLRCRDLGWSVPDTIVTTDPVTAVAFVNDNHGDAIIKAISYGWAQTEDGDEVTFYTRRVSEEDLRHADEVGSAPVMLQRRIPKAADLRVTVVGARVFATSIVPNSGVSDVIDWREVPDEQLRYSAVALPGEVEERCRAVVEAFGLKFGALDLILTPEGEYVFLEINPNGQWAWIEMHTGQPLRRAFIDLFYSSALSSS